MMTASTEPPPGRPGCSDECLAAKGEEPKGRRVGQTRKLPCPDSALALLCRVSRTLNESQVSDAVLRQILLEVRDQLGLAEVNLCLDADPTDPAPRAIRTGVRDLAEELRPQEAPCLRRRPRKDAAESRSEPVREGALEDRTTPILSFPLRDRHQEFGALWVALGPDCRLEPWQQPLLESLAGQLATALNLEGRMHERHRLALHEERSILARELHDSLAQSLSYLKIQTARLEAVLRAPAGRGEASVPTPDEILIEIRDGINRAYRQLRELLTTFRLKIDGQGLTNALAGTVREYGERGGLEIALVDRLGPGLLSPNEEVHVIQIIREALSNVVRHAEANRCEIQLDSIGGEVVVLITDNGKGLTMPPAGCGHYGMTIMRERALILGGGLQIESPIVAGGGTRVRLQFRPRGLDLGGMPSREPSQETSA